MVDERTAGPAPASPRAARLSAPTWLDGRLLLGVLLVLTSVVVGSRVLAAADRSTGVWVTTRDLAAGSQLGEDDLAPARVRLMGTAGRYLSGEKPVGYVLRRSLGEGELLPGAALGRPGEELDYRAVTVPVPAGHLGPDLTAGQQVDVYVTPGRGERADGGEGPPRLVLRAVPVLHRTEEGAVDGDEAVVLQVRPADVLPLLAAVDLGRIDLVRVPRGAEADVELQPAS